jgi:AcrR family transcriptional regulator
MDDDPPNSSPGDPVEPRVNPRRGQRREAILEAARVVFSREGFAEASMSAIAEQLGGSKGTLYSYFESKEELFAAYVRAECGLFAEGVFDVASDGDVASRLSAIGARFLERLLSESAVRTYQLVVAEAHRSPELARVFYEAGPARGVASLTQVLEDARAGGEIQVEDCEGAAQQFMALCRANLHFRYSLNLIDRPGRAEIHETVREAVRTFMARFSAARPTLVEGA